MGMFSDAVAGIMNVNGPTIQAPNPTGMISSALNDVIKPIIPYDHSKGMFAKLYAATKNLPTPPDIDMQNIANIGQQKTDGNPMLQVIQALSPNALFGSQVASGLTMHTGVGMPHVSAVRGRLDAANQKSFDATMASFVAARAGVVPPAKLSAVGKAAFLVTKGVATMAPAERVATLSEVIRSPEAKTGIAAAVRSEEETGLWHAIKKFFGFT